VGKDDTKDQVVTLPLYILAEERTRSSGESGTVILAVKDVPTFEMVGSIPIPKKGTIGYKRPFLFFSLCLRNWYFVFVPVQDRTGQDNV
jgi:hypothetical protein